MWISLGTAVAVVGASFAVGVFLDQYSSADVKSRLWKNISQADRRRWALSAVNIVIASYEAIFSGQIKSWKFFRRSLTIYVTIICLSAMFLAYFFPHVFASVASPYTSGDASAGLVALVLTLLGGGVFWIANAQTLYFLRLAQMDPRPTPVFLIFYADALLTTSICVVGVAILLWLQTVAYLQRGPQTFTLELHVAAAADTLQANLRQARGNSPQNQADALDREIRLQYDRLNSITAVFSRNVPSATMRQLAVKDMELVEDLYRTDGISIRRIDNDTLQFIGPEGEVTGFHSLPEILHSEWHANFTALSRESVCRQLLSPQGTAGGTRYVVLDDVSYGSGWNLRACIDGRIGRITASIDVNGQNIDLKELFALDAQVVFQHIVESVRTGFGIPGTIHPLSLIRPSSSGSAVVHTHMISEDTSEGYIRLDHEFLTSYLAAEGAEAIVLNKSLPVGPMVTAVMATSLFTILLLVSASGAILLAGAARTISRMNGPLLIQRHPFVFVALAAGMVMILFHILVL